MFRWKLYNWSLTITVLILSLLGLVMVYSTSSALAYEVNETSNFTGIFLKQVVFTVLGLCLFFSLSMINYKRWQNIIALGVVILWILLIAVFAFPAINGAKAWIPLGPINLQPAELAKLVLIVFLASYFSKNQKRLNNINVSLVRPLIVVLFVVILVFLENDLGGAVILIILSGILFLCAGISRKTMFQGFLISTSVLIIFYLGANISGAFLQGYQKDRLDLSSPCSVENYTTTGYQKCNGLIAINNGSLFGVGLGNSTQKYTYLPEAHTDFIMAIIAEELGFVGIIFTLLLYQIIFIIGFYTALITKNKMGSLIAIGSTSLILIHFFVNLGGITGLIPLTGVPLPFLSYGGTFILIVFSAMGLLQNVIYQNNKTKILEERYESKRNNLKLAEDAAKPKKRAFL